MGHRRTVRAGSTVRTIVNLRLLERDVAKGISPNRSFRDDREESRVELSKRLAQSSATAKRRTSSCHEPSASRRPNRPWDTRLRLPVSERFPTAMSD